MNRDNFIYMPVGLCGDNGLKNAYQYGLNLNIPFSVVYDDGFYIRVLYKNTKLKGFRGF